MVMTKISVDFFGVPTKIPDQKVEIELMEGAKLKDIIATLRQKIPALEGSIIVPGQDHMIEGYTFNIHGRFYTEGYDADETLHLQNGDHIALLTIPIGG